jgi:hypothetical protein
VDTIKYTGFDNTTSHYYIPNTPGKYMVVFNLEDKAKYRRKDIIINCRYGFKQVTADLLKNIDVYFDTTLLKRYYFGYKNTEETFFKTLLTCFGEMNVNTNQGLDTTWDTRHWCVSDICGYNSKETGIIELQNFRYYSNSGFEDEVTLNTFNDEVKGKTYTGNNNKVTSLGGSATSGFSGGAAFTVGIGYNIALKNLSIGGNFNWNTDKSYGLLTLIDIDGNGLPDKVFKNSNGYLKYRRQLYDTASKNYYFDSIRDITGINNFLETSGRSSSLGGELSLGINAGLEKNKGTSIISTYFSDVNSDGLPDIISSGQVYFNRTNGVFSVSQNDTVYFADSCQYIIHSGSVNDSVFIHSLNEKPDFSNWGITISHDAVRVWRVPYTGTVVIKAPIQLIEDTSQARLSSTTANGVWYFIQHNDINKVFDSIASDDYTLKNTQQLQFDVKKDDMIYFRLNSHVDRSFDKVNWDPQIKYLNQDTTVIDSDNKKIYKYKASEDFLLSTPQIYTMPFDGIVHFTGNYTMPAMSDDITLKLIKNSDNFLVRNYPSSVSVNVNLDTAFSVSANDTVTLLVTAPSNVQWSAINFYPILYYDTIYSPSIPSTDILGNNTVEYHPVVQYSVFPNPLFPSVRHSIESDITVYPSLLFSSSVSGTITLTIKTNNHLISKCDLTIENGIITQPIPIPQIPVPNNQSVYFDYFTDNLSLASAITNCRVTDSVSVTYYQAGLHTVYLSSLNRFGNLYRGWGQFAYNHEGIAPDNAMIQDSLVLNNAYTDTNQIAIDTSNLDTTYSCVSDLFNTYADRDPMESVFIYMQPSAKDTCWKGFGELTTVKPSVVSHTIDTFDVELSENPIPFINAQTPVKAIKKINKSKTRSWFVHGGPLGYSHTSGYNYSISDYIDMNGDGYPDIVGRKKVQYSTPQGGLSNYIKEIPNFSEIFSSSFESQGSTFGTSYMLNKPLPGNNPKTAKNKAEGSGNISGNIGSGNDETKFTLTDINGDGLPDKIFKYGSVSLNLGYKFAESENWNFYAFQEGESNNYGAGVGIGTQFSFLNSSINGGLGASFSDNNSKFDELQIIQSTASNAY